MNFVEGKGVPGSILWLRERAALDVSGADAAAAVGCGAHKSAEDLAEEKRRDRASTDEQLLERSKEFENVHTIAGHVNEDPIAVGCAKSLVPDRPVILYAPRLCMPADPEEQWYGATPDRVFLEEETPKIIIHEPILPIECKFSFSGLPEHPKVDHVMQATVQMRVLATTINYLSYGSRFPIDLPDPPQKWPDYDEPLLGTLMIRVFRIHFSPQLWVWMMKRLCVYRAMVRGVGLKLPRMNHFVNHVWFESPKCRSYRDACGQCQSFNYRNHPEARTDLDYLPPCPIWTRVVPSPASSSVIGERVEG